MQYVTTSLLSAAAAAALILGTTVPADAKVGFGKPGEKVDLVVGYQPYYTESWSGVVINGQKLWKKHLPKGSDVKFEIVSSDAVFHIFMQMSSLKLCRSM